MYDEKKIIIGEKENATKGKLLTTRLRGMDESNARKMYNNNSSNNNTKRRDFPSSLP